MLIYNHKVLLFNLTYCGSGISKNQKCPFIMFISLISVQFIYKYIKKTVSFHPLILIIWSSSRNYIKIQLQTVQFSLIKV